MRRAIVGALLVALAGCTPRNPPVPPPESSDRQRGGVWVAYSYGCERGCAAIQRGDQIAAIDGEAVDAARLADGAPHGDGAPSDPNTLGLEGSASSPWAPAAPRS